MKEMRDIFLCQVVFEPQILLIWEGVKAERKKMLRFLHCSFWW